MSTVDVEGVGKALAAGTEAGFFIGAEGIVIVVGEIVDESTGDLGDSSPIL